MVELSPYNQQSCSGYGDESACDDATGIAGVVTTSDCGGTFTTYQCSYYISGLYPDPEYGTTGASTGTTGIACY